MASAELVDHLDKLAHLVLGEPRGAKADRNNTVAVQCHLEALSVAQSMQDQFEMTAENGKLDEVPPRCFEKLPFPAEVVDAALALVTLLTESPITSISSFVIRWLFRWMMWW
jgi:hypothetical protein